MKAKEKHYTCVNCKIKICVKCKTEAHDGAACPENLDNEFKSWAKQNVKNCPKCKTRTEWN